MYNFYITLKLTEFSTEILNKIDLYGVNILVKYNYDMFMIFFVA